MTFQPGRIIWCMDCTYLVLPTHTETDDCTILRNMPEIENFAPHVSSTSKGVDMIRGAPFLCVAALFFSTSVHASELETLTREIEILSKKIEKIQKERELRELLEPSTPPNVISITSAVYGTSQAHCDAKSYIKAACSGKSHCNLDINNEICGDPTPKPKNAIVIEYECRGVKKTFSGVEGLKINLLCP